VLAKTLFEQAAKLGNAAAMNNLGMLYLSGRGVQRDLNVARVWFEKAIALNSAEGRENLKHLEDAAPVYRVQVAARRVSCMLTCATFQTSYLDSVCERYSAITDSDKPERTKCIDMSLKLAKQCRDSCREWAPTSLTENKCAMCFQILTACSISLKQPDNEGDDKPYAVFSKNCLAAHAKCRANCGGQTAPRAGTLDANGERPN
jgi:TPR repeat protein